MIRRPGRSPDPAVARRFRQLAERILEDERFRRDTTDEQWLPIQSRLLEQARRLADSTDGLSDEQAEPLLERGFRTLRSTALSALREARG